MAYTATVIPIMIASPGDVLNERRAARDVISAWNDIHSLSTKMILTSVGWDTHASPDLGGRAQALINDRVLKDCDLLVGIFWTRLGTPTGKSVSGSAEEIEQHIAAGKPAMVYFSKMPVALDSVDPRQYQALKDFKKWCESKGLIATYDNLPDFERSFARDLQINLNTSPYLISLRAQAAALDTTTVLSANTPGIAEGLSAEAKELLREAASDENGQILISNNIDGPRIYANGKTFGLDGGRRVFARWEYAVEQLEAAGLIDDKHQRQVFVVTAKGYEAADKAQV